MNKGEGARLALKAAENYAQQVASIDRCLAAMASELGPLLTEFDQEACKLADIVLSGDESEWPGLALLLQAPLLIRWLDLLAPQAPALASRLSELEHAIAAWQHQSEYPRLEVLANWLDLQQELARFQTQAHFQTLYQAWSNHRELPLLTRMGFFLLSLIGQNPHRTLPRKLGLESLEAGFEQYASLERQLQAPGVRPVASDLTNTRLVAEAEVYRAQKPQAERLAAFFRPEARRQLANQLFASGLLATLFHPAGHVLATAQPSGLAAAMLTQPSQKFALDIEWLIQSLLAAQPTPHKDEQRLMQGIFSAGPIHQAEHQIAHELFGQQTLSELYQVLSQRVPFQKLARFHALGSQLHYLNQIGVFLAEQKNDRLLRQQKMQRIGGLWMRRPGERLRDKSKWLVEVPEIKARSLVKQLELSKQLHSALCSFKDEAGYAGLLRSGQAFVVFDALVCHARKSIPHEGFNRLVIPELSRQRQGSEKADYRQIEGLLSRERTAFRSHFPQFDTDDLLMVMDPLFPDEVYSEQEAIDAGLMPEDFPAEQTNGGVLEALIAEGVSDGLSSDIS